MDYRRSVRWKFLWYILGLMLLTFQYVHCNIFPQQWPVGVRARRRMKSTNDQEATQMVVEFDGDGDVPQISDAFAMIEEARSIAVMKTASDVLVAYTEPRALDSFSLSGNNTLIGTDVYRPLGSQVLSVLLQPNLFLLATGLAGDCRHIYRYLRRLVIRHSVDYDSPPSVGYLAQALGKMISKQAENSHQRPFVVHVFLIDTNPSDYQSLERQANEILFPNLPSSSLEQNATISKTSTTNHSRAVIYEVNTAGAVWKVSGGASGRDGKNLRTSLSKVYKNETEMISTNDAKTHLMQIFHTLLHPPNQLSNDEVESGIDSSIEEVTSPPLSLKIFQLSSHTSFSSL